MSKPILVVGGTGVAGRDVVKELVRRGHIVTVVSRRPPASPTEGVKYVSGDITDAPSLDDALKDVHTLVDATDAKSPLRQKAVLVRGSAGLVERAAKAGVEHMVLLSIAAVDKSSFGYYKAKAAQENNYESGNVPFTIVRTTQFHNFVDGLLKSMSIAGTTFYPSKASFQPIATSDVAHLLADAVAQGPSGRLPARGGPDVRSAEDLARTWRLQRRDGGRVRGMRMPGDFGRFLREEQNLVPDGRAGEVSFDDWLVS